MNFRAARLCACVFLGGFFSSVGLVAADSPAPKVLDLDQVLDWRNPAAFDRTTFEKIGGELRQADGKPALIQSAAGGGRDEMVKVFVGSENPAAQITVFQGNFRAGNCTAFYRDQRLISVSAVLVSSQPDKKVLDLARQVFSVLYGGPSNGRETIKGPGGAPVDVAIWAQPGFTLRLFPNGEKSAMAAISLGSSPSVASAPPQGATANLDPLLDFSTVWKWTPADLEKAYRPKQGDSGSEPPQFEWLTNTKDRARFSRRMFNNVETRLTMFGVSVSVEEAIIEFVGGRAARATVSFYNRGDSGEISVQEFDRIFKKVGQSLGQATKTSPRSQLMSSNAAVKTIGWNWTTPQGIALLEHNDYNSGGRVTQPEFLRLKLASPAQADWSMGKLSVGVQRMALVKNITRKNDGDVFIAGVPMVDQGAKGYCVAASCQRLFEYMQIPCDQHEMAQLLNVDVTRGANAFEMQKSLAKVDGKFAVTFKPLVNPELYYDNKGKRRVSIKEFTGIIKEHADKGVPLLWALALGRFPEDPPLPGDGQVSGGHMRMIIGYNAAKNQILFTDSWGAGHELKRMAAADAYEATLGLYSMAPRGM